MICLIFVFVFLIKGNIIEKSKDSVLLPFEDDSLNVPIDENVTFKPLDKEVFDQEVIHETNEEEQISLIGRFFNRLIDFICIPFHLVELILLSIARFVYNLMAVWFMFIDKIKLNITQVNLFFFFTSKEDKTIIEEKQVEKTEDKLPELKMDRFYKYGAFRLCQVMKKIPIISKIQIPTKDKKLLGREIVNAPENITLILDYAVKSDINLDDHKHPKRSIIYCMMYLKLYLNEKLVLTTDNFIMDHYLENNLESFLLGFIEEILDLKWSFFSEDKNKWGNLSNDWIIKQKVKMEEEIKRHYSFWMFYCLLTITIILTVFLLLKKVLK